MSLYTQTVTEAVYERIKIEIIQGKYAPGQHLLEKKLSDELEVSRTPIRDALIRLQEEGLVVAKPHRGVFVRKLTEKDIQDFYQTRSVLEGLGAKLAAGNVTEKDKDKLREILDNMVVALEREKEDRRIININDSLHDYIFQMAGNEVLNKMRKTLAVPIALIRATSWKNDHRKLGSFHEHEQIIHGIIEGDPSKAQTAAEEHIHNAWKTAAANIKKLPFGEEDKWNA